MLLLPVAAVTRNLGRRRFGLPPAAGSNAARIASALDGFTVPFSYNTPTDPVETSSATVNPSTIPGTLVAGRSYTLEAGSYGAITLAADCQLIAAGAGVTIASLTWATRTRITGAGGTQITGTMTYPVGVTDCLLDNVHHNTVSLAEDGSLRRLAWINCTMRATSGGAITGANGAQDLIWARCDNQNTDATYWVKRVVGLTRMIDVNNRWSTGAQQARHHNTNTNGTFPMSYFFVSGNQYESNGSHAVSQALFSCDNGGGDGSALTMSFGWVTNNNFYRNDTDNGHLNIGNSGTYTDITVTGNRAFCGTTPGTAMGFISGSVVSDNLTAAFGSGAPPYPYGAN